MMKHWLLILMPALLLGAGAEDAVKQAERDWASAVVKKDYAVLNRVLADDLEYTHSDGRFDTKSDYIESLRNGKQTYAAAEHQSTDVRLIGKDIALVRAKIRMTASSGGKPATPANFSALRVYRLKNGQWQMIGHQSARMAK